MFDIKFSKNEIGLLKRAYLTATCGRCENKGGRGEHVPGFWHDIANERLMKKLDCADLEAYRGAQTVTLSLEMEQLLELCRVSRSGIDQLRVTGIMSGETREQLAALGLRLAKMQAGKAAETGGKEI